MLLTQLQTEKEVEKEVTQETVATSTISEESERATEMMMLADKCEEQGHAIANMQRTIVSLKQELETLYQNVGFLTLFDSWLDAQFLFSQSLIFLTNFSTTFLNNCVFSFPRGLYDMNTYNKKINNH